MMRNLAGRSIDTLGLFLILLAPGVIGFPFWWVLVFVPCWVVFRIWWFYRRAVGEGLLDD